MIVAFGFPSVNWAEETRTELILLKEMSDPEALFSQGRNCKKFFILKKAKTPQTSGRQQAIPARANTP